MSLTAPRDHVGEAPPEPVEPSPPSESAGGRWRNIIPLCAMVVLLAVSVAVLVERRHETVRGARAQIVLVFPGDTSDDSRERLVKTQSQVLSSRSVLDPAAKANGLTAPELDAKLSIDTSLRSDVLTITTRDPDPATAERLSAAIADRYLELSRRLVPESDEGEALVRKRIADIRRELAGAGDDERDVLQDRIGRLQEWILELQVDALERPRARLLTPAFVLEEPLRPQPLRAAAGGLGIGLVLAAALALLLRRWGTRRRG